MVELKEGGLWINGVHFNEKTVHSVPIFESVRLGIIALMKDYEENKKMRYLKDWDKYIEKYTENKIRAQRLERILAEKESLIRDLNDNLDREQKKVSELQRKLDVRATNDETEKGCIRQLGNQISHLQKSLAEKEEEILRIRRLAYNPMGKISSMEDSLRSLRDMLARRRKVKEGDLNAHDKRQLFKDCLDLTRASYSDIEAWVDAAKKLYNELLDI